MTGRRRNSGGGGGDTHTPIDAVDVALPKGRNSGRERFSFSLVFFPSLFLFPKGRRDRPRLPLPSGPLCLSGGGSSPKKTSETLTAALSGSPERPFQMSVIRWRLWFDFAFFSVLPGRRHASCGWFEGMVVSASASKASSISSSSSYKDWIHVHPWGRSFFSLCSAIPPLLLLLQQAFQGRRPWSRPQRLDSGMHHHGINCSSCWSPSVFSHLLQARRPW